MTDRYDTDILIDADERERVVTSWREQAAIIEALDWERFKPVWSERSVLRDVRMPSW